MSPHRIITATADRESRSRRVGILVWLVALAVGTALCIAAAAGVEPGRWLALAGSCTIGLAYTWALAVRAGGRPLVSLLVAGAIAAGLVGTEIADAQLGWLTNGAAVLTAVVTSVFAVVNTQPAVRFRQAAAETLIAVLVAAVGALAVAGFAPEVDLDRFGYVTLFGALVAALLIVYRLGAGLHGLGRRGITIVIVGGLVLAAMLAYTEALRLWGSEGLVTALEDAVAWFRTTFGAVPRPLMVTLGVPALVWGCHMRARRRQGWWVCAFGVAATAPVTAALMRPALGLAEPALSVLYSVLLGLVLGLLVVRLDVALTTPGGARGRRTEEENAVRPEPGWLSPLL